MSLKAIKAKIKSVKKIRQVTRAMEAVSAVKMRKSQHQALLGRPYAEAALSILARISESKEAKQHPLLNAPHESGKTLLIVVTADRGLAGALNSALLREAWRLVKRDDLSPANAEIIAIGKKGREFFTRRGFTVQSHFEHWGEGVDLEAPRDVVDALVEAYTLGAFGKAYLIYTNFLSTFRQEPVVRQFLPVSVTSLSLIIEGIAKVVKKITGNGHEIHAHSRADYIFEPSVASVIEALVPQLLSIELYHAVLESNASEHSARMVAMKTASDRARDLGKELNLEFNKARQSAITSEISELVGGLEAMK